MQLSITNYAAAMAVAWLPSQFVQLASGIDAAPVCNSGGPYLAECSGTTTAVPIDGTASFDPDGTGLTYLWFEECPNGFVDDPTAGQANMIIDLTGKCAEQCALVLRVTSAGQTTACPFTTVRVEDTTPPSIDFCPADITVPNGSATDPSVTGSATAGDVCHGTITPSFADGASTSNPDGSTTFTRTWTANDGCATSTCTQDITVEGDQPPPGDPDLDMHPTSCPNPVNVGSNGVTPAALVGAGNFDVTDVDISTLRLVRHDGVGGSVAPARTTFADVATPFTGDLCDCHTLGGDGIVDLAIKFRTSTIANQLQLGSVPDKTFIQVDLTGELEDGTPFLVSDCIRVINH